MKQAILTPVVRRTVLSIAMTGLLAGCAGQCNILSTDNSFGCGVALVGGAILLAPVLLPMEAAEREAREDAETKDYLAVKEGVEKGELASLERCVDRCNDYLVFMKEKHALRDQAANKLLAFDSPTLPQERVTAMMVAYSLLAWQKDSDGRWVLDPEKVRRGWELAARYRRRDAGDSTQAKTLTQMAENVFVVKLQALPEERVQHAFETCITGNLLPNHPEESYRGLLCGWSYETYYRLRNPGAGRITPTKLLEERWSKDENALKISEREREWLERAPQHRLMATGVDAGERAALEWCVLNCPNFSHSDSRSFRWNQRTLQRDAAKKLIAQDKPDLTQGAAPEQQKAMTEAYVNWIWRWGTDGQLAIDSAHIARAWELASSSTAGKDTLTTLAPYVFLTRLETLPQPQIATRFEGCVSEDFLPAYPSGPTRPIMCERAYGLYRELHPDVSYYAPADWRSRWEQDWDAAGKK